MARAGTIQHYPAVRARLIFQIVFTRQGPFNTPRSRPTPPRVRPLCCARGSALAPPQHYTFLNRYGVAAGSARTIHDYLRPPRLPSLSRLFHHSRLFSIARSLLHPRFRYENRYRNRTPRFRYGNRYRNRTREPTHSTHSDQLTRRPKLNSPPLNSPLIRHSTQVTSTSQITSQNFGRQDQDPRLSETLSYIYIYLSSYSSHL